MNLLLYGGKGWIGQQLILLLKKNNINYINSNIHVENITMIEDEIKNINPSHIISLIGRTHGPGFSTIDYLEQEGKLFENVRDNLFSPIILANLSQKYHIHFTYIGTGCIFNGPSKTQFRENDIPNFFGSSYSTVKGFTDQLMKMYEHVLNIRIRMPITSQNHPRNFITKITNYEKICSIPNSMTVLDELLPILLDMLKNKYTGTINFTNPGIITHNEILEMYKDIVDPYFIWNNFTLEEQEKILDSKRSNNQLDTSRLQQLYPNVCGIKDAVKKCLREYKLIKNTLNPTP